MMKFISKWLINIGLTIKNKSSELVVLLIRDIALRQYPGCLVW